ncbi:MAG: DUF1499 domain-containing protein [Deltaproteobacteria bacterium]|nr:DUF1499 domain-containing protein [Deltaproteobacteria bacterium]
MLWGINGFSVGRPHNIGLKNNLLVACPRSPNCVLSQASDAKHKIKPIYYSTSVEMAKERLNQVILSFRDAQIITQNEVYWHVKFTTRWLGFIDDVEFYFPESEALIHLRSASRSGYWDLGANRKRVEEIRSRFEDLAKEN